jgi:diketogulonate reductase-like aldo/keto reductase
VPRVKAQATQVASRIGPSTVKADFTAAQAAGSLERSLRALGVDHVDLFLLHEALPEDLVDDTLLEFLLAQQRNGVIGAFGVGGAASAVPRLLEERPDYCRVMQFDWSILDPRPDTPGFSLHYGVLGRAFGWLRTALAADPVLQRRWSNEVDRDLSDDDVLSSLLLKAALEVNPTSIVLVSTRHIRRIQANVAVAEDQAEAEPALRLWELVRSEQLLQ